MKSKLTVEQALAEGFEHYIYESEGYQALRDITDFMGNDDYERSCVVCEKEPKHPEGISAAQILDHITDFIESNWGDETQDDTDSVKDALKPLKADLDLVEARIDELLKTIKYYRGTDIALIP